MRNGRLSQKIRRFAGYDYTASTLPMLANHAIELEALGFHLYVYTVSVL